MTGHFEPGGSKADWVIYKLFKIVAKVRFVKTLGSAIQHEYHELGGNELKYDALYSLIGTDAMRRYLLAFIYVLSTSTKFTPHGICAYPTVDLTLNLPSFESHNAPWILRVGVVGLVRRVA